MAVRPILLANDPTLRKKSKKVNRFGKALSSLVEDMVETMHAANGMGLAAPQIGVLLRVIVIELPKKEDDPQSGRLFVLVNPKIARAKGEEEGEEGCLSIPGYVGDVKRATMVTVKGYDISGKKMRMKARGLLARVLQHEIDHLNGILFIDRVERPSKIRRVEPAEKIEL
jgi:peptide deformylase